MAITIAVATVPSGNLLLPNPAAMPWPDHPGRPAPAIDTFLGIEMIAKALESMSALPFLQQRRSVHGTGGQATSTDMPKLRFPGRCKQAQNSAALQHRAGFGIE